MVARSGDSDSAVLFVFDRPTDDRRTPTTADDKRQRLTTASDDGSSICLSTVSVHICPLLDAALSICIYSKLNRPSDLDCFFDALSSLLEVESSAVQPISVAVPTVSLPVFTG